VAVFKFYTYKVPRGQVEAALTALPYVAEGYIMPVADPQCDTRTAALVRFHKKDSGKGVDLRAIRNDMATKMSLPAYQLPTVLRTLREHESVPRTWSDKTAMMKAIHMFFPLDSEDRICGEETEVLDVSDFMKMQTTKLWELSGIR
jgi:malonyl-CoA/methylmalonyl-CoA synthetase